MAEEKIYQPKWDEHKERERKREQEDDFYYYHRSHRNNHKRTNTWGGAMKHRDKQAYYGIVFLVVAIFGTGAYLLIMMFVNEWRAMPHDDPKTEMKVDELDVNRVDKQDALMASDSIAKTYQFDSTTIKRVQTVSHHVYRPPRKNTEWYITEREWKDIFKNFRRWRKAKENDKQFKEEQKRKDKE